MPIYEIPKFTKLKFRRNSFVRKHKTHETTKFFKKQTWVIAFVGRITISRTSGNARKHWMAVLKESKPLEICKSGSLVSVRKGQIANIEFSANWTFTETHVFEKHKVHEVWNLRKRTNLHSWPFDKIQKLECCFSRNTEHHTILVSGNGTHSKQTKSRVSRPR